MKRLFVQLMLCALAVAVTGMAVWRVQPWANRSSARFRCGLLGRANDPYLDDSGKTFQRCTWHIGIGTRTWGETYDFKLRRVYVSMQVTHVNPRLTPREAREDE
jgi:hypothetical protein